MYVDSRRMVVYCQSWQERRRCAEQHKLKGDLGYGMTRGYDDDEDEDDYPY